LQITTVVKVQNCGETDVKSMTITLAAVKDFITKESVSKSIVAIAIAKELALIFTSHN